MYKVDAETRKMACPLTMSMKGKGASLFQVLVQTEILTR